MIRSAIRHAARTVFHRWAVIVAFIVLPCVAALVAAAICLFLPSVPTATAAAAAFGTTLGAAFALMVWAFLREMRDGVLR